MKIILLKSHENLGNVGDIVNVKPGYARNYLFPNEIATVASESNRKKLDSFLKAQELKEAKNRTNMELLFKQLNKVTLKFELESGEDDKLFGSVTSQMIIDALADLGYTIDKKEIIIDESIKTLGNHFIHINLDYELKAKVKVKVSSKK
jgi:large subunit ribosomal protein L9